MRISYWNATNFEIHNNWFLTVLNLHGN